MRKALTIPGAVLLVALLSADSVSAKVWRFTCTPQRVAGGLCTQAQSDAGETMVLIGYSVPEARGDEILNALALGWGWSVMVNGLPHPETAEQFANRRLKEWLISRVREVRAQIAAQIARDEELAKPPPDLGEE